MSGLFCPYCKNYFVRGDSTFSSCQVNFYGAVTPFSPSYIQPHQIELIFKKCPACNKDQISLKGIGNEVSNIKMDILPNSKAKVFPDYIPSQIIQDYNEACLIVDLSPKASATLSRRCLQGIIRDYWKISKGTLVDEIKAVETKVDPDTKDVLHSLRKLGNIGAHPEKDINLMVEIEPDEANQLILFLEYLFEEWYIKTHNRKDMLQKIKDISKKKDDERKNQ